MWSMCTRSRTWSTVRTKNLLTVETTSGYHLGGTLSGLKHFSPRIKTVFSIHWSCLAVFLIIIGWILWKSSQSGWHPSPSYYTIQGKNPNINLAIIRLLTIKECFVPVKGSTNKSHSPVPIVLTMSKSSSL